MTKSRRVTSGERLYLALSDARVADYFVHEFMCRLAIRLPGCDLAVSEERRVAIAAKRAWMKGGRQSLCTRREPTRYGLPAPDDRSSDYRRGLQAYIRSGGSLSGRHAGGLAP